MHLSFPHPFLWLIYFYAAVFLSAWSAIRKLKQMTANPLAFFFQEWSGELEWHLICPYRAGFSLMGLVIARFKNLSYYSLLFLSLLCLIFPRCCFILLPCLLLLHLGNRKSQLDLPLLSAESTRQEPAKEFTTALMLSTPSYVWCYEVREENMSRERLTADPSPAAF